MKSAFLILITCSCLNSLAQKLPDSLIQEDHLPIISFIIPDNAGRLISLDDYKGKVVIIDFWFTGCGGCSYFYQHTLLTLEAKFGNKKDIVFLSVCVDKEYNQWQASVKSGLYTSTTAINLYLGERIGTTHHFLKHYHINSYPQVMIIDKKGLVYMIIPAPYKFSAEQWIGTIKKLF